MLEFLFFIQDCFSRFFLIPALVFAGLFLSFKMRFAHVFSMPAAVKFLFVTSATSKKSKKNISSFAAFSAILGGNLGVGNISGTAIALTTGGPGAIMWMAIIVLCTTVIKYVSCYLGLEYRIKRGSRFIGGPMYFMRDGVKSQFLAVLFCVATICTAVIGGSLVQVNSLTLPMQYMEINPLYGGFFIAFLLGLVILAGVKIFTKVVTKVVPFMAISYLLVCIYILIVNSEKVLPGIYLIFNSVLNTENLHGGITGFAFAKFFSTMQVGVSRGIFATDIGFGLEAILHSNVKHQEGHTLPLNVEQGLISVLSPFIVLVVCFITALVLIVTGAWQSGQDSTNMCFEAFKIGVGSEIAGYFLMIVLFCFAFTTILTWSFCADRSIEYLTNYSRKALKIWQVLFIMIMPFGAILKIYLAWRFVDLTSSVMLFTNLIAISMLWKGVISQTKKVLL